MAPSHAGHSKETKNKLLHFTEKHIQGLKGADPNAFYHDLESLGPPASYATLLVDVFWMLWVKYDHTSGAAERMNLVQLIKACRTDKRVSEAQLLEVLEHDCLQAAGLLRDVEAWKKKEVRFNTRSNYTMSKFNLLREDSEGYAKLVTLLNAFGPSDALSAPGEHVLATEMRALIGCFDLDPNRCLDLLLDAAAARLDVSGGPSAQEGAAALLAAGVRELKEEAVGQLMGFKLQHYQSGGAPAPRSLFLVAALLVQGGLAGLLEVLGHASPNDADQVKLQKQAKEALREKVDDIGIVRLGTEDRPPGVKEGGGGALTADGFRRLPVSAASFDLDPAPVVLPLLTGNGAPMGNNQPLALLDALLEVGAWESACELFERLMVEGVAPAAHAPISGALCRLLAKEVEPRYDALFPQGTYGRSCLIDSSLPPAPDKPAPRLTPLAVQLLQMLGCFLHRDVCLFTRVLRLTRHQLILAGTAMAAAADGGGAAAAGGRASGRSGAGGAGGGGGGSAAAQCAQIEELLLSVMLPALMCCPMQQPLAAEVWELFRLLPVQSRYRIYADLKDLVAAQPYLQGAWRLAVSETKKVLKRLVLPSDPQKKKEACRPHSRMIAKIAYSNPLPVLETIVMQVEAYDNQIEASLDVLRYMSPMCFDALTFVIISRLSLERDKVKEDGVNISNWLQSLARFTGGACRRNTDIEVGAILQFLVNALRAGDSFDLLVLQQIIVHMTGVRVEARLSDEQLESYAGGPELVAETLVLDGGGGSADAADAVAGGASGTAAVSGAGGAAGRIDKALVKGRAKLLRALYDADGRRGGSSGQLALPLLILTAQQRSIIVTHTESKLIKFIASMYDRCQDTLLHLCEFLRLAMPLEQYANLLPLPDVLRTEYGIDVEVVWHVWRPVMSRLLEKAAPQAAEEGEVEEGEDMTTAAAPDVPPREEARVGDKSWGAVLASLPGCVGHEALWGVVTPEFYATFWALQLQDIYVPLKRYEREIADTKSKLQLHENHYTNYMRPGQYTTNPNVLSQYEQYKADRQALQDKISRLNAELDAQRKHVSEVQARLALAARNGGFIKPYPALPDPLPQPKQGQLPLHLQKPYANWWNPVVQELILPRVLMSASDALFCARFFFLLHSIGASNFCLPICIEQVFRLATPVIRSATEVEAANLAIFLHEVLKTVMAWRLDEKLFDQDLLNRPTFKWPSPPYPKIQSTFQGYCKTVMLFHVMLNSTLRVCMDSNDYTAISNALSLANRIVTVFPAVTMHAQGILGMAKKLMDNDPREDIKTMARSYDIALKREMGKEGRMFKADDFGGKLFIQQQQNRARGAAAAGPGGARGGPGSNGPGASQQQQLNAGAKPFVPKQGAGTAGTATGKPPTPASKAGAGAATPGGDGGAKPPRDRGDRQEDKKGGAGAGGNTSGPEDGEVGPSAAVAGARKRPRIEAPPPRTVVPAPRPAGGAASGAAGTPPPGSQQHANTSAAKKPRTEGGGEQRDAGPAASGAERERGGADREVRGGGGGGGADRDGGGRGTGERDRERGDASRGGGGGGGEREARFERAERGDAARGEAKADRDRGDKEGGGRDKAERGDRDRDRGDGAGPGGGDGAKEGAGGSKEGGDKGERKEKGEKSEKHKRSRGDKERDKDKDKEKDKEERREEKERRREAERAEKAERGGDKEGSRAVSVERSRGGANGDARRGSAAADLPEAEGPSRDKSAPREKDRHGDRQREGDGGDDGGGKRRRTDAAAPSASPQHQRGLGGGGLAVHDLRAVLREKASGVRGEPAPDHAYDDSGVALPPGGRPASSRGPRASGSGAMPPPDMLQRRKR